VVLLVLCTVVCLEILLSVMFCGYDLLVLLFVVWRFVAFGFDLVGVVW